MTSLAYPLDLQSEQEQDVVPSWLAKVMKAGYVPYISVSKRLLPYLNTRPFGIPVHANLMEDPQHQAFHEAYLLSNSLSFKSPDLKMPNWVLIDCVLMQTAIVGFMKPLSSVPEKLLDYYKKDKSVEFDKLSSLPVSGQIASQAAGGNSLIGISLFSLGREVDGIEKLGLYTKALALEVYRAASYEVFRGIAQYDNPSLKIHGRFTSRMEICEPIVPLHPRKDMTLIYQMKIDYDPYLLDEPMTPQKPTFWMNARDLTVKKEMQDGINNGKSYVVVPPYSVMRDGQTFLPVVERKPAYSTLSL